MVIMLIIIITDYYAFELNLNDILELKNTLNLLINY